MKSRLLSFVLILGMLVLLVSGCATSAKESSTTAETTANAAESTSGATATSGKWNPTVYKVGGGNKIGITVIDGSIPHCQAFIQGAKDVIEANGDTAVVLDPGFDATKQVNNINDFVMQGVAGIVCETIDGAALITAVEQAVNAGVLVVSADFPFAESRTDLVVSQVMTNNVAAGEALAEQMAKDLNYKGKIITLAPPGSGSQARVQGFKNVIAKYPDMELTYEGDGGGNIDVANKLVNNLMQAHTDIAAYICSNDEQAIGAYTAYEAAGKQAGTKFYGFDAAPEAIKFIEAGKETASLRQNPYLMAKMAAEDLYKALNGQDVGELVKYVPYDIVTKENASQFTAYYTGE
jgi:ABC-type sugar transport system substrate-binding protein